MDTSINVRAPANQLLVYTFGSSSGFEGQLVGALERIESGGAMRVLEALFVGREAESGELVAVSITSDGSAGMIGRLVGFRLDPGERGAATRRALDGPAGDVIQALGASLGPGSAVVVVLVKHAWVQALQDAIDRTGGTQVVGEFVDAGRIHELLPRLRAATAGRA